MKEDLSNFFSKKVLMIFVLIFIICFAFAEDINSQEEAINCINDSLEIVSELNDSGFSILRASDLLKEAGNIYLSQEILSEKNLGYNFSLVIPICEELEELRKQAYESRDSYTALTKFYNETFDQKMDTSSVDSIFSSIKKELVNERYEKIPPLIDFAYEEILRVKSENTAFKLFYASTRKTLGNFFKDNLYFFSGFFIVLLVSFLVYRTAILRHAIKTKIRNLEWRKESLKELIGNVQKGYFEKGTISESDYVIRTQNFAEMIRDIDREIPLLKEEVIKLSKRPKMQSFSFGLLGKDKLKKRNMKRKAKKELRIKQKEEKKKKSSRKSKIYKKKKL